MMAEKARMFNDRDTREKIMQAATPGEAKSLGRQVRGFREEQWGAERFSLVVRGNAAKFDQNEPLRRFLCSTGTAILVEASPVDRIWGIGLAQDDPAATEPRQWLGENLLGFALMRVRTLLAD